MARITAIEEQVRKKNRVNIYVDGAFFSGIFTELVHQLKLEVGKEINTKEMRKIIEQEMYMKAREKSLQIISYTTLSERALVEKLIDKGFNEDTCNKVIEWMKEYGFIDEERFVRAIARDRSNFKLQGKQRIKQALYQKKYPKELIEEAVGEIEDDTEYSNALVLAQKKHEKLQKQETDKRKMWQKLTQHLVSRGYGFNIIGKVVKEVLG